MLPDVDVFGWMFRDGAIYLFCLDLSFDLDVG